MPECLPWEAAELWGLSAPDDSAAAERQLATAR
jgi:hypothetical protein